MNKNEFLQKPYVLIDGNRTYFNIIFRMSGGMEPLTREGIQSFFFWESLPDEEKTRVLSYFEDFDCWPPE